jgi:hypothetical protein
MREINWETVKKQDEKENKKRTYGVFTPDEVRKMYAETRALGLCIVVDFEIHNDQSGNRQVWIKD